MDDDANRATMTQQVLTLHVTQGTEADSGHYHWVLFTLAGRELWRFKCEDRALTVGKFLECVKCHSFMELEVYRDSEAIRDPQTLLQQGENIVVKGWAVLLLSVACGDAAAAQHALPTLLQLARALPPRDRFWDPASREALLCCAAAEGLGHCAAAGRELAEQALPALIQLAWCPTPDILCFRRELWALRRARPGDGRAGAPRSHAAGLLSGDAPVSRASAAAPWPCPHAFGRLVESRLRSSGLLPSETSQVISKAASKALQAAAQVTHVAAMLEELSQDNQCYAAAREKAAEALWAGLLRPRVEARDVAAAARALPLLLLLARSIDGEARVVAAEGLGSYALAGPELAPELAEWVLPALLHLAAESDESTAHVARLVSSTACKVLWTVVQAPHAAAALQEHACQEELYGDMRCRASAVLWDGLLRERVEAGDEAAARRALPLLLGLAEIVESGKWHIVENGEWHVDCSVVAKGLGSCAVAGGEEAARRALPALMRLASDRVDKARARLVGPRLAAATEARASRAWYALAAAAEAEHVAGVLEELSGDARQSAAVRGRALEALCEKIFRSPSLVDEAKAARLLPLLLQMAEIEDAWARRNAARGLGELRRVSRGTEPAREALLKLSHDRDGLCQDIALRTIHLEAAAQIYGPGSLQLQLGPPFSATVPADRHA